MLRIKNRPIVEGQRVFVYYNLHKHVFSIKSLEGETKGKVIAHAKQVLLKECEFKVSQKGRERVLKKRQKNVHAGVVGKLILSERKYKGNKEVTYNPYDYSTFVIKENKKPIHKTDYAYLENKKVFI
jgi:hypothetical protein